MYKNRKSLFIIAAAVLSGLFLAAVEYTAHQMGLELRTFAQIMKGCCLWLILPCIILFTGNNLIESLMKEKISQEKSFIGSDPDAAGALEKSFKIFNSLRKIVFVIILLVILFISIFRGLIYMFSRDMVTEKKMPDGHIQGMWADFLSESHYTYYIPVAGIFRKPFQNWTEEQILEKMWEKYGSAAELIEIQEGGWYVFRLQDKLAEGEYIYFHVSDSYNMESNDFAQILISEASHFWNDRKRAAMLVPVGSASYDTFEEAKDTGEMLTSSSLLSLRNLCLFCGDSEEEMDACAADITDWLQFVNDTGQYPYDYNSDTIYMLANIYIRISDDYFSLSLYPVSDLMKKGSWDERYQQIQSELTNAYEEHLAFLKELEDSRKELSDADTDLDYDTTYYDDEFHLNFMDSYDGSYEQECTIGDGSICYRMIVSDAALGHRLYSLLKSTDGGKNWQMSSPDPFDQQMGMEIEFTFLNENFGFATLAHNGGDSADLYITEDGGDSYQAVVMESYTVTLENGHTYNPYDYPQMPYEENGIIYVLCGQGADGDYAGGDEAGLALYQSTDGGHTFSFLKIQEPAAKN